MFVVVRRVCLVAHPTALALQTIPVSQIRLLHRLGAGSFAEVHLAEWQGLLVAVKKLLGAGQADAGGRDDFRREAVLMSRLRHPNVLLYLATCEVAPDLWILTEYMPLGSLYQVLVTLRSCADPLCVVAVNQCSRRLRRVARSNAALELVGDHLDALGHCQGRRLLARHGSSHYSSRFKVSQCVGQ